MNSASAASPRRLWSGLPRVGNFATFLMRFSLDGSRLPALSPFFHIIEKAQLVAAPQYSLGKDI